jgi:hypothetical protein
LKAAVDPNVMRQLSSEASLSQRLVRM